MVGLGCSMSAYSLFVEPIEADLGATRAQTNLGMSIFIFVMGAVSPLLGWALARGPARAIMLTGVFTMAAGLVLLSRALGLLEAALLLGLLVAVGQAMFGYLPTMTLVANWFIARRGTAIGIAAIGMTIAGFASPPITALLIESFGWRGTLLVYAGTVVLVATPVIWIWIVNRPEDVGQFADGDPRSHSVTELESAIVSTTGELLMRRELWLIAVMFGLLFCSSTTLLTNVVPYASDLGIERGRAAYVLSGIAVCSALGKLIFGPLVDRIPLRAAMWLSLAVQAIGWALVINAPNFAMLLASTALWGLGMGGTLPIQGVMLGRVFGREDFGQAMGLILPLTTFVPAFAPPLVGHFYDVTGSYTLPFTAFLAAFAIPAVLLLFVRMRPS